MDQDQQPKDEQQPDVVPQAGEYTPPAQPVEPQTAPTEAMQTEVVQPAEGAPETTTMPSPETPVVAAPVAPEQPTVEPVPVMAPTDTAVDAHDSGSRNFLAAFLMTISLGYYGLHQVYLGRKVQGWIRFALALAAFPLMFVFVGFLIIPVLAIWAAVDFFLVYLGKHVDGEGKPLTASAHDKTWARTIFIVVLVLYGLYIAGFVLAMTFGLLTGLQHRNDVQTRTFQDYNINRSY